MAMEELEIDDNQVEEKDPYSDLVEISSRIDKILSNDKFSRALFESEWARNVFFIAGAMWLKKVGGRWTKRDLPEWFPRAQTNKFAEKFNDLVTQLIQGGRVPISYIPATDDEADIGTAEVGERIREVFYTEAQVDEKSIDLASWLIATGNVFGIPHYDMDPSYGMATAPRLNCPCGTQLSGDELVEGACPECGAPADQMQPAQDEAGNPLVDEYPIGALQLDIASPFEIRGDYRITNIRKWTRFVRQRRYELDWAKEHWPDFKDSIIPDGGTEDVAQYYLDLISNLTSSFAIGSGVMSNGPNSKAPKVTAYEIYELPSEEFPQGLRAVRLGDNANTVVEAGPLPSAFGAGVKQGQKFLPLIHWGALKLPGRLWYKSPLDDVVPLQVFRNMVEANIRLSIQRMGNAIWLLPKGCAVDILTGEPGQQVSYNPVSVGGTQYAKPERMPADLNNLGAMVTMLKVIDDAIERVSGTFFLQGGNAPPGVTAASALAYLGEQGSKALSTLRTNWALGWREFDMMSLEIIRENWDDTRMRTVAGKNRKWQVEKFTKADLQGSVNLIIDYNGLAPKSNATERAAIAQLIQLGIVNPQDGEMQIEVLKKFGELDLKGSLNIDIEDAAKEQDRFMTDPSFIPQVRPFVDNSTVHLSEHTDLAKTDEFRELPLERQQVWYGHIENTVHDIVTRRVMLTQAGLDPDVPALEEVPSGDATVAAQQAAAMQNGGVSNGAQSPDPRLNPDGTAKPQAALANAQLPDIADQGVQQSVAQQNQTPASITPPGSPRRIDIPGGGQ